MYSFFRRSTPTSDTKREITSAQLKTNKPPKKPFRILSLDGGGVRGLVQAIILKRLVQQCPNLLDEVDMFTGTSAGSIVAISLACGMDPAALEEMWLKDVGKIFCETMWHKVKTIDNLFGACYKQDEIKLMIRKTVGDRRLKDLPKKILIPAFNLDPSSTRKVSSHGVVNDCTNICMDPHEHGSNDAVLSVAQKKSLKSESQDDDNKPKDVINEQFQPLADCDLQHCEPDNRTPCRWTPEYFHNFPSSQNEDTLLFDVCLRSSAAPTYFPIYQGYCDGGAFANNPALSAVTSAICAGENVEDICVLSISTGNNPKYIPKSKFKDGNWGLYEWGLQIIELLLDSTTSATSHQCRCLLNDRYHRVDPLLQRDIALDNASPAALKELIDVANTIDLTPTIDWIKTYWMSDVAADWVFVESPKPRSSQ